MSSTITISTMATTINTTKSGAITVNSIAQIQTSDRPSLVTDSSVTQYPAQAI